MILGNAIIDLIVDTVHYTEDRVTKQIRCWPSELQIKAKNCLINFQSVVNEYLIFREETAVHTVGGSIPGQKVQAHQSDPCLVCS